MTTTTREPLICECGHTGYLVCRENDQPYSAAWEEYSLEGFVGERAGLDLGRTAAALLELLQPKCPACGRIGMVRYA